jgi:hypothetical protein
MKKVRAITLAALAAAVLAWPAQADVTATTFGTSSHRHFDFWIGEWVIDLATIEDDLGRADPIQARALLYPILNGKALLELWDSTPIKGYSLRYYDADSNDWVVRLNWPGGERANLPSLTGRFRDGRGEVEADGRASGRFALSDVTPFSLRWFEAVSPAGKRTWRKNRRMRFTRTAVDPDWPSNGIRAAGGNRAGCANEAFGVFAPLAGQWNGDFAGKASTLSVWEVLDGCAMIAFLDVGAQPSRQSFMLMTYDTERQRWEIDYLDGDRDSPLRRLVSDDDWTHTRANGHAVRWAVLDTGIGLQIDRTDGSSDSGKFTRLAAANP